VDEPIHDLPFGKVLILVDPVETDEPEKIGGNGEPAGVAKSRGRGVGGQRSELATELPIELRLEFLQSLRVEERAVLRLRGRVRERGDAGITESGESEIADLYVCH
jgi:hypothetical protein